MDPGMRYCGYRSGSRTEKQLDNQGEKEILYSRQRGPAEVKNRVTFFLFFSKTGGYYENHNF
jgi:hypothetical protein